MGRGSEVCRPHFLILHNAGRRDEKGIIKQSGGRGFRVLRTRPTSASCTRHWSQRSRLLYHYCLQILPPHLPPTLLPFPSLLFFWMPSDARPPRFRPCTRAGTTKGTARRRERRRQMTRGSCFLDRSHVTSSLKPRGRGLSCPR